MLTKSGIILLGGLSILYPSDTHKKSGKWGTDPETCYYTTWYSTCTYWGKPHLSLNPFLNSLLLQIFCINNAIIKINFNMVSGWNGTERLLCRRRGTEQEWHPKHSVPHWTRHHHHWILRPDDKRWHRSCSKPYNSRHVHSYSGCIVPVRFKSYNWYCTGCRWRFHLHSPYLCLATSFQTQSFDWISLDVIWQIISWGSSQSVDIPS
jgi:hypothetical protein